MLTTTKLTDKFKLGMMEGKSKVCIMFDEITLQAKGNEVVVTYCRDGQEQATMTWPTFVDLSRGDVLAIKGVHGFIDMTTTL